MTAKVLGMATDLRTNTPVIYAQMSIEEYLLLIGDDFDKYAIQRKREKHRAYARMKSDIVKGALLPTITLAVSPERVPEILPLLENKDFDEIAKAVCVQGKVNILDGLQRTYILKDLSKEGHTFVKGQFLLLEFWLEHNIQNLIYRIIVLNAGQKPMSMRHQIEVLFATFKDMLENEIEGLELYQEKEGARRTKPRKYALDRIVTAYQSYLSQSPEIHKENIVAQQLVEEDILSDDEESLGSKFNNFKKYLNVHAELDDEICRIYNGSQGEGIPTGLAWFGNENVMNSFFAALSDFGSSEARIKRIDNAISHLLEYLKHYPTDADNDPLGLGTLQNIINGFPVRKVNVGFATRKLLNSAFKEYFREEGEKELREFWVSEAE
jgi:hypothetical protein